MNYPILFLVVAFGFVVLCVSGQNEDDWEFLHYKLFNCKGDKRTPEETLDLVTRLYPKEKNKSSKKELQYLFGAGHPEETDCYWGVFHDFRLYLYKYQDSRCTNLVDYLKHYLVKTFEVCEIKWRKFIDHLTDEEKNLIDLIEQSVNAVKPVAGRSSGHWADDYHVKALLAFMEEHGDLPKPSSSEEVAECNERFKKLIQDPCRKVISGVSGITAYKLFNYDPFSNYRKLSLHEIPKPDEFANVWIANKQVCSDIDIYGDAYNKYACKAWIEKYLPIEPMVPKEEPPPTTSTSPVSKCRGLLKCFGGRNKNK